MYWVELMSGFVVVIQPRMHTRACTWSILRTPATALWMEERISSSTGEGSETQARSCSGDAGACSRRRGRGHSV